MTRGVALALWFVLALSGEAFADHERLVRLAVIDCSGSMGSGRLGVAQAELLELARQLPPAPDAPFIVVQFTDSAREPQTFTDLPTFEACVRGLTASGGTRIAAGLQRAITELDRFRDARHWALVLVSDGEDQDVQAIQAQEARLNQQFALRHQRGLSNTVFCRRWEGANADLVARLRRSGNAVIVDASDARMVALTFVPQLQLLDSRWVSDTIEARIQPGIEVRGSVRPPQVDPLILTCVTQGVGGDTRVSLGPLARQLAPLRLTVPVSPQLAALGGTITLEFTVSQPSNVAVPGGVAFTALASDRLQVQVPVPARGVRVALSARLTVAAPARWTDPLAGEAALALALEVSAAAITSQVAWPGPVRVEVAPRAPWLVQGTTGVQTVELQQPGTRRISLTLVGHPMASGPQSVSLSITATGASPFLTFEPRQFEASATVPLPPQVVTRVRVRQSGVATTRWVDLVDGTAAFEAQLEVEVQGPLAPNADFVVQAPPGVVALEVRPGVLRSGLQTIAVVGAAKLQPNQENVLPLAVVPPTATGCVSVEAPGVVRLILLGPSPVSVAAAPGPSSTLNVSLGDMDVAGVLPVVPVLLNVDDPTAAERLQLRAALTGNGFGNVDRSGLRPLAPVDFPVHVGLSSRSFVWDTFLDGELSLAPQTATPAVVGTRQHVMVRMSAPLKRLLSWGGGILFIVTVLYFGWAAYGKLSAVEVEEESCSDVA